MGFFNPLSRLGNAVSTNFQRTLGIGGQHDDETVGTGWDGMPISDEELMKRYGSGGTTYNPQDDAGSQTRYDNEAKGLNQGVISRLGAMPNSWVAKYNAAKNAAPTPPGLAGAQPGQVSSDPNSQYQRDIASVNGNYAASQQADQSQRDIDSVHANWDASQKASQGLAAANPYANMQNPITGPDAMAARATAQAASDTYQAQSLRYDDQYKAIQGRQNALTPDMIAAGTRSAFNQPYLASDGQDARGLAAQNGGGHMGGYGSANQDAIRAGAGQMANTAANTYGLAAANEQNNFTQQKGSDLASLNAAYGNIAHGWGDLSGAAQRTSEFNTNQTNMVNANYSQGAAGILGAGLTALGNKTASDNLGNIGNGLLNIGGQAINAIGGLTGGQGSSTSGGGGVSYPSGNNGLPPATGGSPTDNSGLPGATSGSPSGYHTLSLDENGQPKQPNGLMKGAPANYRGM